MTTTPNNEPWHVAIERYQTLSQIDSALLLESEDDTGEAWEQAHDQTSAAIDLLIDTPAGSLSAVVDKLRVIIRHSYLEGPSDDIDDPAVREAALADSMRDGAWPLLRVLEDLERLLLFGFPRH